MTTTAPWASLTPRERDALVAVFMGWEFRKPTPGPCCTCQHCGRDYDSCGEGCHYTTEREAALCVEDEIERRNLQDAYLEALASIAGPQLLFDAQIWAMLRATPEQRCHAALIAAEVHDE